MVDEERYKIINGDSLVVLDTLEENSIDAIITDPPYELGFMGKKWDATGIAYNVDLWKKAFRVMKCGGYLLAFGGSRTYHRIACAIEDAGFEIRDTIMWLYGSGFPKSMNIGLAVDKKNGVDNRTGKINKGQGVKDNSKNLMHLNCNEQYEERKATNEWDGWGTCLKPAFEPVIVARKPVEDSVINNVLKYGVGGINIDECRMGTGSGNEKPTYKPNNKNNIYGKGLGGGDYENINGRFPANVILTYDETDYDEVCGGMPDTNGSVTDSPLLDIRGNNYNNSNKTLDVAYERGYNDSRNACRYFYCAKASKKDRDNGLLQFETKSTGELQGGRKEGSAGSVLRNPDGTTRLNAFAGAGAPKKNVHPCVKPVDLMQYLVRLVCPKGATILDIFNGSGSTGKAVAFENRERDADYKYIGIELDAEYCEISKGRIDYAINKYQYDVLDEIKENEEKGQLSLFDFAGD